MSTRWEYASDTKQIYAPENDSDGGKGIAENYGDEAQGLLLAAAPLLLAACQAALDDQMTMSSETFEKLQAAIAAALPIPEPCQRADMSYLDPPPTEGGGRE